MSRRAKPAGGTTPPNVQITAGAKTRFVAWLERNRRPHMGETVGAITDWFVVQPKLVRNVVLGEVPDEVRKAYAAALREMAKRLEDEEAATPSLRAVVTSAKGARSIE